MKSKIRIGACLPLVVVLLVGASIYLTSVLYPEVWESLRQLPHALRQFNEEHPLLTPILYILTYVLYVLLLLPGIILFAMLGGFLFAQPFSILYVIIGVTLGASCFFLIARMAFRVLISSASNHYLNRFEEGFKKNATNYMLFLRLLPFFPFRMANVAGAFFDIPLVVFAWTTFVGMLPSVVVYTQTGKGLSSFLIETDLKDPWKLVDSDFLIAFTIFALSALIPIFFKNRSGRKFK